MTNISDGFQKALSDYACICKDGYKPSLKKFMQQFRSTVRFKGSNIATKALVIKEFKKKMTDMGLDADYNLTEISWDFEVDSVHISSSNSSSAKESTHNSSVSALKRHAENVQTMQEWVLKDRSDQDDFFICNENMSKIFWDFQVLSLNELKLIDYFTWKTHLHQLFAMSSILFLDGEFEKVQYLTMPSYQSLYKHFGSMFGPRRHFPYEITIELQKVLQEFKENRAFWDLTGKLSLLAQKYKDDDCILAVLQTILAVVPELNVYPMKKSEMHVSTSFVHNFVKNIFKVDIFHNPHCSNIIGNFDKTRPDYRVDCWTDAKAKFTNVFGEFKSGKTACSSAIKDIYRIGVFSQIAIEEYSLDSVLSFRSIDAKVIFYIMKKVNGMYFFGKVCECNIPTTISMINILQMEFNAIYNLRRIYKDHCNQHKNSNANKNTTTLPWSAIESLLYVPPSKRRKSKHST